jgi:hypothetical protein
MLQQDFYVREKLKDLPETHHLSAQAASARVGKPAAAGKPALAPLARPLGRALHRIGHRLETWAAPTPAEPEPRPRWRTTGG